MSISEAEKGMIRTRYLDSNKILFGKILQRKLQSAKPEFGFFQEALTRSIVEFFRSVFRYRQQYGFGMNGTIYIPPNNFIPVVGPIGSPSGTTVCISSFITVPLTTGEVTSACKDTVTGYWGKIFELMGNYFVNTTVVMSNPAAMGFTYSKQLRTVYPLLPQSWKLAGIAFEQKIKTKQVDDHDYLFMAWSEEIDRLIKNTTSIIPVPSWPVIGGIFSGSITASWTDFNSIV